MDEESFHVMVCALTLLPTAYRPATVPNDASVAVLSGCESQFSACASALSASACAPDAYCRLPASLSCVFATMTPATDTSITMTSMTSAMTSEAPRSRLFLMMAGTFTGDLSISDVNDGGEHLAA